MIRSNRWLPVYGLLILSASFTAHGELIVPVDETYENDGYLENYNLIDNRGVLTNNGDIYNRPDTLFYNTGLTDNFGFMDFDTDSRLQNFDRFINSGRLEFRSASLENYGTFDNHGSGWVNLHPDSSLFNYGTFNNDGVVSGDYGAILNNAGVLTNTNQILLEDLVNSGELDNQSYLRSVHINNHASGVVVNQVSGTIESATVRNDGEFTNHGLMMLFESYDPDSSQFVGGRLVNNGLMNHMGIIRDDSYEGLVIENTGEFNNTGVFEISNGMTVYNSGVFNNRSILALDGSTQGEIYNDGTFNNDMSVFGVERLENSGTYNNDGDTGVMGHLINHAPGLFNNAVGALLDVAGVLENQGQFDNQSTIYMNHNWETGTAPEIDNHGVFDNYGSIITYSPESLRLSNSGTFNHYGDIQVDSGLSIRNSGTFNNYTSLYVPDYVPGEIINAGVFNNHMDIQGVRLLENSGMFDNQGGVGVFGEMFNGASGSVNNSAYGFMNIMGTLDNQGEFDNAGYIDLSSWNDYYTGLEVEAEINNGGTFNHHENAVIDAWEGLVINNSGEFNRHGDLHVNGGLVLNNTGTFNNGGSYGYPTYELNLNYDDTINNYGVFNNYAGIRGDAFRGAGQIMNTGTFNNYTSVSGLSRFSNSGTLNNRGEIEPAGMMVNHVSGVINNGDGSGVYAVMRNVGGLDNRGVLNNSSGSVLELSYDSSTTNSGILNNDGETFGYGDIDNSGTINNNGTMTGLRQLTTSGTLVNEGQLSADSVHVTGGVLKGNGSISVGNGLVITEAGTLAPGDSVGEMNVFGDVVMDGTLDMEFDGSSMFGHDSLWVEGNVTLGQNSTLDVSFLGDEYFALGDTFDLMFAYDISGDFGNLYYDALLGDGLSLEWYIFDEGGMDVLRLDVVSAVPLPAAVWLFLSGLLGLTAMARRKRWHH